MPFRPCNGLRYLWNSGNGMRVRPTKENLYRRLSLHSRMLSSRVWFNHTGLTGKGGNPKSFSVWAWLLCDVLCAIASLPKILSFRVALLHPPSQIPSPQFITTKRDSGADMAGDLNAFSMYLQAFECMAPPFEFRLPPSRSLESLKSCPNLGQCNSLHVSTSRNATIRRVGSGFNSRSSHELGGTTSAEIY